MFHNNISSFKFSEGEGYGVITNGATMSSAPNSNSYVVKFTVSNEAKSGDVIPLKLKLYSGVESKDFDMNLKVD